MPGDRCRTVGSAFRVRVSSSGVTAGTIDSMVTNYTAAKKKRRVDVYRPGGEAGRPNRATIAYTAKSRHHFRGVPVIIGGLEAGPRRLAYWDFWDEKYRRSILDRRQG